MDRRHRERPQHGRVRADILLATVDAGPIAMLYAAAHPGRVDSLVLCATARYLIADDYPIGFSPEALDFVVEFLQDQLGYAGVPLACWCSRARKTQFAAMPLLGSSGRRSPPENRGGTVRLPAWQSRCSPGAPAPPGAHTGPERRQPKLSSPSWHRRRQSNHRHQHRHRLRQAKRPGANRFAGHCRKTCRVR